MLCGNEFLSSNFVAVFDTVDIVSIIHCFDCVSASVAFLVLDSVSYDRHIRQKGYPFLDSKEEITFHTRALDVMQPSMSSGDPLIILQSEDLTVAGLGEKM